MLANEGGHNKVVDILLQHGASADMRATVSSQLTELTFMSVTNACYIKSTESVYLYIIDVIDP